MITSQDIKNIIVFLNRVNFDGLNEAKEAVDIAERLLAMLPPPQENTDGSDVPANDESGANQPD